MAWTLSGRLEPRTAGVPLAECRVEVFFDQKAPVALDEAALVTRDEVAAVAAEVRAARRSAKKLDALTPTSDRPAIASRASARTDKSGRFDVVLPDTTELATKKLRFVVSAPSGQTIADEIHDVDRISQPLKITVSSRDLERIPLTPPKDPPPPETRRIRGHVIDRSGKRVPANLQVLLFVRKRGEKGAKADDQGVPILVARADASGYFSGVVPNQVYDAAAALVSGVAVAIPVALEEGLIPAHILLVVDFAVPDTAVKPKGDDCECKTAVAPPRTPSHEDIENAPNTYTVDLGTGGCVQFNTPNRAIEEFDFYTVVRTTEPEIRGRTLAAPAATPPPATTRPEAPPAQDPRVSAVSYDVRLETGDRGTWGAVSINLLTDAARFVVYFKDSVNHASGSLIPNLGDPRLAALQLVGGSVTLAKTTSNTDGTTAIGLDLRDVRQIEVVWTSSNLGDAWALRRVEVTATSTQGEAIPVIVATQPANDIQFTNQGAQRTWTSAARIPDRTPPPPPTAAVDKALVPPRGRAYFAPAPTRPPSRAHLDAGNPIDWDSTPTFHEAATIAHGHLLHFKQVWYADGYSLGDLLYSLPLAPGQKKLISVVDWERRERTERTEATFGTEELSASLSRDRDLSEVVTGALTESARGGSRNTTAGVGVGTGAAGNGSYGGFNFGALLGVSGGYGESNSSAWQDSARTLSATSIQNLRDRTLQSASAVRGQRSSIVHTVSQGEAVRATTEVVANHNHCHALTIQYFEVLRHLKLVHELTDVQECLFVPLPMAEFDLAKALRWRQPLRTYLQRRELADAFDAARRVDTNWSDEDVPLARYADEVMTAIAGELLVTIIIPLPPLPERPKPRPEDTAADTAKAMSDAVNPTSGPMGILFGILSGGATVVAGAVTNAAIDAGKAAAQGARAVADQLYAEPSPQERYEKFHHEILPGIVEAFVDQFELWALVGANEIRLGAADFTLVSEYQPGIPLVVSLRATLGGSIRRSDVTQLIVKSAKGLPSGCRAIVNSATIRYRTAMFEHALVDDRRVNDDIDLPKVTPVFAPPLEFEVKVLAAGTGATLYAPIDAWEQRRPRMEDWRLSVELLEHLNANLEFYHHAIWWTMDPNRRYMLLDGYFAPGANERSVASVVENRLIGIVGNCFVLPVARGNHLDPRFEETVGTNADLLEFYALDSPLPPARVSIPSRGVFAEAVMGSCNACEQVDDSRFWRWEDSPIDEPPAMEPVSTATRRTEPAAIQPTPFPTPLVAIQAAPAAPDPTGVGPAIEAISRPFADMAGLAGTQANAAAAYTKAVDTALAFGKEASTLAQQAAMINAKDKALGAIDQAEEEGKIDPKDAKDLRVKAFRKMVGDTPTDDKATSVADRLKVIDDQEDKGSITKEKAAEYRETVMKGLDPEEAPKSEEQQATTEVIRKIPGDAVESVETKDASGATTAIKAKPTAAVTGRVAVDIILRAFVPSPVWVLELPKNNTQQLVEELIGIIGAAHLKQDAADLLKTAFGKLYLSGDGREFSLAKPKSTRFQARTKFQLATRTMKPSSETQFKLFADVVNLYKPSSVKRAGTRLWEYELVSDTETPLMSGVPEPGDKDVQITLKQVDTDQLKVNFKIETKTYCPFLSLLDPLKDAIPDTDTAAGNFNKYADAALKVIKAAVPSLKANVTVDLTSTAKGIQYELSGTHDPFPNYEIYVNQRTLERREARGGNVFELLMDPTAIVSVATDPESLPVIR